MTPRIAAGKVKALVVDPKPRFDLSPNLFMQFMEPLGATEGSVAAAWDHWRNCWREDLVEVSRELAPPLIRWGGCFASYYRWKEGVGPRSRRKPMYNLLWRGMESNQVGTHELVDFCRQVGAEPLIVVNFESDGRRNWARPPMGGVRSGTAREAAEWVDYCNNPANALRRRNGAREPFGVRIWQIGNETSYDPNGFDCETAARKTLSFARAMRKADPDIELIGWGDSGWARRMLEVAGDQLQYVAFHHGFGSAVNAAVLGDTEFRKDPARTWSELMNAHRAAEEAIGRMREQVADFGAELALTECHLSLPGRNRGAALSTWAAGVANARVLNIHARNGDVLKIATLADFFGTRWMNNAVIMPTPGQRGAYMMPVARVMALYRAHVGRKAVGVSGAPRSLDVTASRTGRRVFLHVVNINRTRAVSTKLSVEGWRIRSGRVFQIAADPMCEIMQTCPDVFDPVERVLPRNGVWRFPPASVSAVELHVAKAPRTRIAS